LRRNLPITATDLAELEIILLEQAGGDSSLIDKAKQEAHGLGLFVRSLVGLDKAAAAEAMNAFLTDSTVTNRQIEFVNLIVDELTKNGAMEDRRLYQSPFVDMAPTGPEGIFASDKVQQLFASINEVRLRAVA
jgi:type I restriction enzyme R subunit